MSILGHLFTYLRAVFFEGIGIVFTLFDVLGILVFLNPSIGVYLSLDPNRARLVAVAVFQVSFLLGNLRVHRRLTIELANLKSQPKAAIKAAIEQVAGVEETYVNQPLDRWAAKIRIANTGMDPPSIHGVIAELVFRKPFGDFSLRAIITSLVYRRLDTRPSFLIRIPIYMEGLAILGSPPTSVQSAFFESDRERHPLSRAKEVFVADWETKQPIGVRPHHEIRAPMPGMSFIWVISGNFPSNLARELKEADWDLTSLRFRFQTDKGDLYIWASHIPLNRIDADLREQLDLIARRIIDRHPELTEVRSILPVTLETGIMKSTVYDIKDAGEKMRTLPPSLRP